MEELLCISWRDCISKFSRFRAFQMMGGKIRFHLLGFKGHSDSVGVEWALSV